MNRAIMLIAALLISFSSMAKKVKFAVDMRDQPVNVTGIHVMGDFQAIAGYPNGDWQPNTTLLTNEPGTSIYSIVIDLPAFRKYEYRYVNGDQTYESEFVPEESRVGWDFVDNRWIYIDSLSSDTSYLPVLMFSSNAPFGKKLIRMRVSLKDEATVSTDGVHTTGTFNNWSYTGATMYSFGRRIFEYLAYADSNASVEYIYLNGNNAGKVETVPSTCAVNGNRNKLLTTDYVTDTLCFSSCTLCLNTTGMALINATLKGVYPVPAANHVIVQFHNDAFRTIDLYDIHGKLVQHALLYESKTLLDVSTLKNGVYLMVSETSGIKETARLLIQHDKE